MHDLNEITYGEAVKGMIMNGLGFSNRALSLSPQIFENVDQTFNSTDTTNYSLSGSYNVSDEALNEFEPIPVKVLGDN